MRACVRVCVHALMCVNADVMVNVFTGIYHRLHYPTISMTFLDDTGSIISVPSQCHSRSTLSGAASSLGKNHLVVHCMSSTCLFVTSMH